MFSVPSAKGRTAIFTGSFGPPATGADGLYTNLVFPAQPAERAIHIAAIAIRFIDLSIPFPLRFTSP
jgi:hypothetical protein